MYRQMQAYSPNVYNTRNNAENSNPELLFEYHNS